MEKIRIRFAKKQDALSIARVQVESYTTAYAGLMPPEYLAAFSIEEQEQDWMSWSETFPEDILLVAEDGDGSVVGYSLSRIVEDPIGAGEVAALHVLPSLKKSGIGRKLLKQSVSELITRGVTSIVIWTLVNNPSRGFYEHFEGQYFTEKDWNIDELNFSTKEVCYLWKDLPRLMQIL